jgi:hypothetical protein
MDIFKKIKKLINNIIGYLIWQPYIGPVVYGCIVIIYSILEIIERGYHVVIRDRKK